MDQRLNAFLNINECNNKKKYEEQLVSEQYLDKTYIELENGFLSDEKKLGYGYIDQVLGSISELDRETLEKYFNYESFGRDLILGGDFSIDSKTNIAVSNY